MQRHYRTELPTDKRLAPNLSAYMPHSQRSEELCRTVSVHARRRRKVCKTVPMDATTVRALFRTPGPIRHPVLPHVTAAGASSGDFPISATHPSHRFIDFTVARCRGRGRSPRMVLSVHTQCPRLFIAHSAGHDPEIGPGITHRTFYSGQRVPNATFESAVGEPPSLRRGKRSSIQYRAFHDRCPKRRNLHVREAASGT